MLKFIIDTQLPPLLADYLRNNGFDSIHTTFFQDGHLLTDKEIIQIALAESRIIISKDSDFVDHFLLKGAPPKILLLALGNIKNKDLLHILNIYLQTIILLFQDNASLVILQPQNIISYS
jgi:predicted nuclease of predicted toxin-antitoxin system